jgi:hypothetical protein
MVEGFIQGDVLSIGGDSGRERGGEGIADRQYYCNLTLTLPVVASLLQERIVHLGE